MRRPRAFLSPLLFLGVAALTSCINFDAIGQKLGSGVITGARSRQGAIDTLMRGIVHTADDGVDSLRGHVDSAVRQLGSHANAVLDTALDSVETRALRMEDSLGAFIDHRARTGFAHLLAYNLQLVRDTVRKAIDVWAGTLRSSLDTALTPALKRSVAAAVDTATLRLGVSMDSTGRLGAAVVALSDRVVRQAVRALADESKRKTPAWVWLIAVAGALVVVSVVGRFLLTLRQELQNRETSLRLVSLAIQERKNADLADRVKALATEHGVEPWLHTFLTNHHLLVQEA